MYTRILVAVDGSQTSRRAFEAALALARSTGAFLQPFYVVENTRRLILGSVAERCVRQARLPVLLIPSAAGKPSDDAHAQASS